MDQNTQIDRKLAEAFRIAVRDFGETILSEERLMGILKDFHAFQTFPQGEFIVRTLISDATFSYHYSICKNNDVKHRDFIHRETQRIARQYGFSYSLIRKVIISFLNGMGVNVDLDSLPDQSNKNDKKESQSNRNSKISLEKTPTSKTKTAQANSSAKPRVTPPSKPTAKPAGKPTANAAAPTNANQTANNPNNHAHDDLDGCAKYLLGMLIIIIMGVFLPLLVQECSDDSEQFKTKDTITEGYYPEIQVVEVVDSVLSYETDTIQTQQPVATTPVEPIAEPEEKPAHKKKLDPRFYHPDGTHKQPHEYMKYFNEDEYDDEDYEDGYEDGYDDALDEL